MTTSDRSLSPVTGAFRSEYRRLRDLRTMRRTLRRELAEFSSTAERLELSAVLRRHDAHDAAEVRDLLD
jgi:hypothetical protein